MKKVPNEESTNQLAEQRKTDYATHSPRRWQVIRDITTTLEIKPIGADNNDREVQETPGFREALTF